MGFSRGTPTGANDRSAPRPSSIKASMYFAFGKDAREGVRSRTTFEAVLAGERTSTTRFPAWGGYERWKALKPGDSVRFYADKEMRGRYVDVIVDSVEPINLVTCSNEQLEAWSQAEGWTAAAGRGFGRRYGAGLQIRYHIPR